MDGFIPPRRLRLLYGRVPSRFSSTAAIVMTGFFLAVFNPTASQGANPAGSIGKGPVGWDSYRRLDLLPALRSGAETRDFSSTDPAQQNGDFNHPLRVTSDGQYVIAEAYGPGEIVSIWSTINGGDVTNDGAITIQLDRPFGVHLDTTIQPLRLSHPPISSKPTDRLETDHRVEEALGESSKRTR
jgi:hypothetical protein